MLGNLIIWRIPQIPGYIYLFILQFHCTSYKVDFDGMVKEEKKRKGCKFLSPVNKKINN